MLIRSFAPVFLSNDLGREQKKTPPRNLGGGPTMLDGMFTCRGGEDLSGGTLDVRCELGVERAIVKCCGSIGLEGATPTAVPASSWCRADGSYSEARRTLF